MSGTRVEACDLCGSGDAVPVLETSRLDGPLVRCRQCGLHYIAHRASDLAFGANGSEDTAERIRSANRAFDARPLVEERRLNALNARWRMEWIADSGANRLLEVGCGRGDFLRVAAERFDVSGVEPHPELAAEAGRYARVHRGRIEDLPRDAAWMDFDAAASFHVLEHVDSPVRFVGDVGRRLRPGGLLVLETPDIGSAHYRFFGARWRQFIPEHYFFFDKGTLTRLLETCGFRVVRLEHVGKHATLGLFLNRLGRQFPILRRAGRLRVPGTIRINPRDVLLALAIRRS